MPDRQHAAHATVRPGKKEDAIAIGEAHGEGWRAGHEHLFEAGFVELAVTHRKIDFWPQIFDSPEFGQRELLVAEDPAGLSAFSYFGPASDGNQEAEIFAFDAHPRAWGTGALSVLMHETTNSLRSKGVATAHVWIHASADRAREFYEASGFRLSGAFRTEDFGEGHATAVVEFIRDLHEA